MILATDVQYHPGGGATAAGVLFQDWTSGTPDRQIVAQVSAVAPYRPGAFFERELPCLMAVLDQMSAAPSCVIVDGYVTLGAEGRDGLGAHLHRALGGRVPVLGVAKSRFDGTPPEAEILRGRSSQPLFVTAIGMPGPDACACIARMHGPHRIPTLLRRVDRLARGDLPAPS